VISSDFASAVLLLHGPSAVTPEFGHGKRCLWSRVSGLPLFRFMPGLLGARVPLHRGGVCKADLKSCKKLQNLSERLNLRDRSLVGFAAEELYASGYSDEALDRWAARIRLWSQGLQPNDAQLIAADLPPPRRSARDVFVYFDNDAKVRAPFDARSLRAKLA
jgi:uncharacterized protein YecE (DUF72 family)